MPKILVVHGAGMNMRGKAQIDLFGPLTLAQYDEHIRRYAHELEMDVEIFHSNVEGEVINKLYLSHDADFAGCIINPAGFTVGYGAVNQAITQELHATSRHLLESWLSEQEFYRKKYPGFKQAWQFLRWIEFWVLDFVWGNGESIVKLLRTIAVVIGAVAIYDVAVAGDVSDLGAYWSSIKHAPAVFLGVQAKDYPPLVLSIIAASRYVSLALMTALLVKRFGRR